MASAFAVGDSGQRTSSIRQWCCVSSSALHFQFLWMWGRTFIQDIETIHWWKPHLGMLSLSNMKSFSRIGPWVPIMPAGQETAWQSQIPTYVCTSMVPYNPHSHMWLPSQDSLPFAVIHTYIPELMAFHFTCMAWQLSFQRFVRGSNISIHGWPLNSMSPLSGHEAASCIGHNQSCLYCYNYMYLPMWFSSQWSSFNTLLIWHCQTNYWMVLYSDPLLCPQNSCQAPQSSSRWTCWNT